MAFFVWRYVYANYYGEKMYRFNLVDTKKIFKPVLILIIGLQFLILLGCGPGGIIPTPYDVTPITQTSTPCPEVDIDSSGFVNDKPVFIVVSIENDTERGHWLFESESYNLISKALQNAAEPGDSIVFFKLGPLEFKDALVFDGRVGSVFRPNIPPTLTPIPSITATNTPVKTEEPGIFMRNTKAAGDATQTIVAATATQIETMNRCGEQTWRTNFAAIATQWEATRISVKATFDGSVNSAAIPSQTGGENYSDQVFEGLQHATRAFNQECDTQKYRRCLLVIFSDLSEYRVEPPDYFDPPINLENVEVLAVMLNCPVLYEPECKSTQDTWGEIFDSLDVARQPEFINGDDAASKIVDFIKK